MPQENAPKKKGLIRRLVKWLCIFVALVVVVAAVAFCILFRTALYHRFVQFPKQQAAWEALRAQRQPVALDDGWVEYRGACHSHSKLSHDCEAPFEEILAACKEAEAQFIFMSDHCVDNKADYSLQWRGDHDGVIFSPGFEMSGGFMPWGLPSDTVLDNGSDLRQRAKEIDEKGGVLFFAHSEEERLWDLPELVGMEIYNIHSDFKDEQGGLGKLLPDILFSLGKYHDQVLRLLYDRQTAILARWDELNRTRRIVGIAGNDCHQNTGIRGYYTKDGKLLLRERGPEDIGAYKLNWITRGLLRLAFGPLEPGKELFCLTVDKYVKSLLFSTTHVLAREKSEAGLLEGLREGRAFVGFDLIADARGFTYLAEVGSQRAVMGETIAFQPGLKLKAESPLPCHFILVRDGKEVATQDGRQFEADVTEAGNYRIEADVDVLGEWTPWVYTNPIRVAPANT